jgi:hypothetical protein
MVTDYRDDGPVCRDAAFSQINAQGQPAGSAHPAWVSSIGGDGIRWRGIGEQWIDHPGLRPDGQTAARRSAQIAFSEEGIAGGRCLVAVGADQK